MSKIGGTAFCGHGIMASVCDKCNPTSQFETTPAGVIDWKMEALRSARLLTDTERRARNAALEEAAEIAESKVVKTLGSQTVLIAVAAEIRARKR
jgi:hypothetical protein